MKLANQIRTVSIALFICFAATNASAQVSYERILN